MAQVGTTREGASPPLTEDERRVLESPGTVLLDFGRDRGGSLVRALLQCHWLTHDGEPYFRLRTTGAGQAALARHEEFLATNPYLVTP